MCIHVNPAKTYQQQLDSALFKSQRYDKAMGLEAYSVGLRPEWAQQLLDHFCK
jgi:hypothetical protein